MFAVFHLEMPDFSSLEINLQWYRQLRTGSRLLVALMPSHLPGVTLWLYLILHTVVEH